MPVTELEETAHNLIAMGQKLGDANQELILAQADLQQSQENLQALVNAIDDIIIQIDASGQIKQIWSKSEENLQAFFTTDHQSICSLINPEYHSACRQRILQVIATGQPETMEYGLETPQGKRWFQARISKIADTDATLVFTARDITERIFMEMSIQASKEEAEKANRAKSEFLSHMSHELRTPLNAILGFSQLMEMNPQEPLSESQGQYVAEIIRAGDHLLNLINEILDLSRIESGRFSLSNEPVELITLVDEIISLMQPLADQNQVTLSFEPPEPATLTTVTDRTRLKQILINLISNAIKYNRPDGRVTIRLEKTPDRLCFHVIDTGLGIPADQLTAIFDPFLRLPETSATIEGTGIGLTLVKQLCQLINGSITVTSTPGDGSHFCLTIPFTERADRPDDALLIADDVLQTLAVHPCRLLYVEDNQTNLKLMESSFAKIPNIELLTANSGEQGLELAHSQQPDLIILDIHLSGMDGYEVLARLKTTAETSSIPVVALSASAMATDIDKGLAMGFADYFTKPVNITMFLSRIQALLNQTK